MSKLKAWLANSIIVVFYRVLYWAWKEKTKQESEALELVFWQEPRSQGDRARMN